MDTTRPRKGAEILPRASIIITCYNYAHFLPNAVDSALALDYPDKEVIVIDNGSKDNSRAVIEGYGERVRPIYLERNVGVLPAFNIGYGEATGDIVYFLDADDMVCSGTMREAARHLVRGDVSKVQFRLGAFDKNGKSLGNSYPNYPEDLSPDDVLRDVLRTALYPCPPTSGSIYPRWYAQRLMPLPENVFDGADGALNTVAPLYGKVVTINKVLAYSRSHPDNYWGQGKFKPHMLKTMINHDLAREAHLRRHLALTGRKVALPRGRLNDRAVLHLMYRLTSMKLVPENHPLPDDRVGDLVWKGLKASLTSPNIRLPQRLVSAAWFLVMGASRGELARRVAVLRFNPTARPKALIRLLRGLGVVAPEGPEPLVTRGGQ